MLLQPGKKDSWLDEQCAGRAHHRDQLVRLGPLPETTHRLDADGNDRDEGVCVNKQAIVRDQVRTHAQGHRFNGRVRIGAAVCFHELTDGREIHVWEDPCDL